MIGLLLAVPDIGQETELVLTAPAAGFRVVRRCVDAVDLFAAAAADPALPIVVSAGLPRLGADAVDRLAGAPGRRIVGIAGSEQDAARLRDLGVAGVVRAAPVAEATWQALVPLLTLERVEPDATDAAAGVWATGCWQAATPAAAAVQPDRPQGRVIAVWGPMGAPGRTTVALGVAEALADAGHPSCVVDADTYAPSVTMALGIVEDASGLVVACRHADNGLLSPAALIAASRRVRGDLHVLGGLARPGRWPDLRHGALDRLWPACRAAFDVTVVDVGFCVEDDEGAGAPWSRRRNAAALSALSCADHVIAVADSSALGAARLASAWGSIVSVAPDAQLTVVHNRFRGRGPERRQAWEEGVREAGITSPIHRVPADGRALESCWARGRSLAEGARRSSVRRSFAALAGALVSG